jgi:segregation and condensation protein B
VTTDERPDSLASAAAAWVPPWERPARPAAAPASDAEPDAALDTEPDAAPDVEEVPDELPAVAGEAGFAPTVDAPLPTGDPEPLDPDIPVPAAAADDAPDQLLAWPADDETADEAHPAAVPPAEVADAHEPAVAGGPQAATVPVQTRGRRDAESLGVAADLRTQELPALTDDADLRAALESILLVVDQPVAEMQLAQVVEQPTERVAAMLEAISADYTAAGRGFDLRRAAGGWRLYTRPEYAPYVERFVLDGQTTRLTQAALETLAVVAYKQPVTRSRISAIRGVNCDGVMRTLVTRGLIEEVGTEPESGAYLYRTTTLFLEKLGLNSVDQLPALAPFLPDDVEEEFDAQR